MKAFLALFASTILASVSAAPECKALQFAAFLPSAVNPLGPMVKCSIDIKENPFKMLNPAWIPPSTQSVDKFAASANCKKFYASATAYMKTIKPPCVVEYINGAPITTDVAASIPFEMAIMTWKALYAAGAIRPPECTTLQFLPIAPVLLNPVGPLLTCAVDIKENPVKMFNPAWVPKNLPMVNAFAASGLCKEFYAVVTSQMGKIPSPCIVMYLNGVPVTSDVAAKIPFDMAILTWQSLYPNGKEVAEVTPSLRA
ncbi:hypothetical protein SPRG_13212 [Saprolegnia parasitica CBS 223.65]|uniref:Secreted protein n=1 Tax=Saprolegnia parasitica (strain CBS 223.65) TaxID=695850 RepID=A0A067C450_SAPPC|nr:hypothetical protein SPRG_13212 [Saprolegnia parasitica CBS 223.65]KDO21321.1 hypothetical protein SPRG_13212 [Saprolegnia parasitica CBS 223.65]|eukprot:XP_012207976.1 hypothetical protein SPRG_13212 [Saprolegnia parasitica CBS 223.65]